MDAARPDIFLFLKEFGDINGLLILGIVAMFGWVWKLNRHIHNQHREQLKDRQLEINRLAEDNHAYRDRFLAVLDEKFPHKENEQ